jgi:hypothetical protein
MKHYKTRHEPAKKVEVCDKTTCDFCGRQINDWDYDIDTVEIQREVGAVFPDSVTGSRYIVDMCGECWDEKFVPWLHGNGVIPTQEKWDY